MALNSTNSKVEDSKDNNTIPKGEAGTETSAKTPGFEILTGILGVVLCQILFKKRD